MEESIIMAVRCPCCDTLLFESDKHKYKAKVSHMQKGIDDNYKMSRPNVQKILYKNVQLVCLS